MRSDIEEIALQAFAEAFSAGTNSTASQVLTKKEKITVGKRLLIAHAILAGKTRFEINERIGVSPNTFAQINRWLESELDEYSSAHQPTANSRKHISRYVQPFSLEDLSRRYPGHFLLFNAGKRFWKKK